MRSSRPLIRAAADARRRLGQLLRRRDGTGGAPPYQLLPIDFPVVPDSRWGYDQPAHPELEERIAVRRDQYAEKLRSLLPVVDELAGIPFDGTGREPRWVNGYCQGLDAASIYGFLAQDGPERYVEIGCGHSTRFARAAIERHDLPTRITAIDPSPRAEVRDLVDVNLEVPLERVDQAIFADLGPGDIVMFDGSHRSLTNSDVTVFFCEVLPRLSAGVLVYVDDVFLPWDYPPQFRDRWYSEQYLLACWLLAGERLEVTLPNFWVCTQPELHRILAALWDRMLWAAVPTNGTGFWMTTR